MNPLRISTARAAHLAFLLLLLVMFFTPLPLSMINALLPGCGLLRLEFTSVSAPLSQLEINPSFWPCARRKFVHFAPPSANRHQVTLGYVAPDASHRGPVEILGVANREFPVYMPEAFTLAGGAAWAAQSPAPPLKAITLPGEGATVSFGLIGDRASVLVNQRFDSAALKVSIDGKEVQTHSLALPVRDAAGNRKRIEIVPPKNLLPAQASIAIPFAAVDGVGFDPKEALGALIALRKVSFSGVLSWSVALKSGAAPDSGWIRAPWPVRMLLKSLVALPILLAWLLFWQRRRLFAVWSATGALIMQKPRWAVAALVAIAAVALQSALWCVPFVERVSVSQVGLFSSSVTGGTDLSLEAHNRLAQTVHLAVGKPKARMLQFAVEYVGRGASVLKVAILQRDRNGAPLATRYLRVCGDKPGPQLLAVDLPDLAAPQDLYLEMQVESSADPAAKIHCYQTEPSGSDHAYGDFAMDTGASLLFRQVFARDYTLAHDILQGRYAPVFYPHQSALLLAAIILFNLALAGTLALWASRSRKLGLALVSLCGAVALLNFAHYLFVCDDAFISFRYARNLAAGLGLVFNPGERVEGYTNFLWVMLMWAAMKAGLSAILAAPALSLLASGALLFFAYRMAREVFGLGRYAALACVLLLAASRQFGVWSSGGLETRAFSLFVFAGLYCLCTENFVGTPRRPIPLSAVFLVLACLTRPEGLLFTLLAGLSLMFQAAFRRPASGRRYLASWFLIVAAGVGSHMLWRKAYYGEFTPNTYYAKMIYLPDPVLGLKFLMYFLSEYGVLLVLPLLLAPGLILVERRNRFARLLLLGAVDLYLGWLVWGGADLFEFRAFDVVFAPLIILAVASIRGLYGALEGVGAREGKLFRGLLHAAVAAAVLWFLVLPHSTNLPFSAATPDVPDAAQTTWTQEKMPLLGRLASFNAIWARESNDRATGHRAEHFNEFCRSSCQFAQRFTAFVRKGAFTREDRVVLNAAGIIPYYLDVGVFDNLGLNEATVARLPKIRRQVTAHEKNALELAKSYVIQRDAMLFFINRPWSDPRPPESIGKLEDLVRSVDNSLSYWLIRMRLGEDSLYLMTFDAGKLQRMIERCRRLGLEYKVLDRRQLTGK